MKDKHYNQIVNEYRILRLRYGMDLRSVVNQLVQLFDHLLQSEDNCHHFKYSLIYSVIGNEFKSEMISFIPKFNWNSFLKHFCDNYCQNGSNCSLIGLSEDYHMSYAIVCQHILQYCHKNDKTITKALIANTSHIMDGRLAFDSMVCNLNDIIFGSHSNHMTNNTGVVFEAEISQRLKYHKISYLSEDQLRSDCFDVTPDFKLNLPLILMISKTNVSDIYFIKSNDYFEKKWTKVFEMSDDFEYVVITWIECKSLFASLVCHSQYYRRQYSSYINRFGNGLVLYKYGFVSDIRKEFKQNIVISNKFPQIIDDFVVKQ